MKLTNKQRYILCQLGQDVPPKQIAASLGVHVSNITYSKQAMFKKYGANGLFELLVMAAVSGEVACPHIEVLKAIVKQKDQRINHLQNELNRINQKSRRKLKKATV